MATEPGLFFGFLALAAWCCLLEMFFNFHSHIAILIMLASEDPNLVGRGLAVVPQASQDEECRCSHSGTHQIYTISLQGSSFLPIWGASIAAQSSGRHDSTDLGRAHRAPPQGEEK